MKKVIVYGIPIVDKKLRKPTHYVTSILVDNYKKTARFVIEKGLSVDSVELSIDECQSLGILNIERLENFCK